MKIDYELVEKIGATHYLAYSDDVMLYKFHDKKVMCYFDDWDLTCNDSKQLKGLTPIPPKPQVRVEYEKVEFDKISDLAISYENGEVFYAKLSNGNEYNELSIYGAISFFRHSDEIFRRIEKPVDWRMEVIKFLNHANVKSSAGDWRVADRSITDYDFLDMCRVALRANGEL